MSIQDDVWEMIVEKHTLWRTETACISRFHNTLVSKQRSKLCIQTERIKAWMDGKKLCFKSGPFSHTLSDDQFMSFIRNVNQFWVLRLHSKCKYATVSAYVKGDDTLNIHINYDVTCAVCYHESIVGEFSNPWMCARCK